MTNACDERVRTSYDEVADVLYISLMPKARARSDEDSWGVVWRTTPEGQVVGATVQKVHRWAGDSSVLVRHLAQRLPLSAEFLSSTMPV